MKCYKLVKEFFLNTPIKNNNDKAKDYSVACAKRLEKYKMQWLGITTHSTYVGGVHVDRVMKIQLMQIVSITKKLKRIHLVKKIIQLIIGKLLKKQNNPCIKF